MENLKIKKIEFISQVSLFDLMQLKEGEVIVYRINEKSLYVERKGGLVYLVSDVYEMLNIEVNYATGVKDVIKLMCK